MKKLSAAKNLHRDETSSVLDDILNHNLHEEQERPTVQQARPFEGLVIETRPQNDKARLLVQWKTNKETVERWLQPVRGVSCARGDTVLVQPLRNRPHPVVTGVLTHRVPEHEKSDEPNEAPSASSMVLEKGKTINILAENGRPLIAITDTESGPSIRLLIADTDIDLPGKLSLNAESINLNARKGKVEVKAEDDVVVEGKNIYLN